MTDGTSLACAAPDNNETTIIAVSGTRLCRMRVAPNLGIMFFSLRFIQFLKRLRIIIV
ncbi:hypothetical protein [Halomonas smyrnensis]|uniref:hypothetical protein n=1 Tax=Halomonas smyrnensis TaxID=720605 RepID=UPI00178C21BA|nr:hypothetical protein [Halomonas smyrnensis]